MSDLVDSLFNTDYEVEPMWTRETAIPFLAALEEFFAQNGYHCALGGSVMYRGDSDKDLDVIVYPHIREDCLPVDILWERLVGHLAPSEARKAVGSCRDGKDVRVMLVCDRRIDFFFLK